VSALAESAGSDGSACTCGARAITFLRYSGAHLCTDCFKDYVEARVRAEVRGQLKVGRGKRIAVAVSGGKDSLATLVLLHKIAGGRPDSQLLAITVNEGIAGYRPPSLVAAAGVCAKLGVEHRIVDLEKQALITVDEIAAANPEKAPCSYCGVLRRRAANAEARRWGADVLATGHNLDDVAQSILMSFTRGDLNKLARLAPHDEPHEGLVPRILPLRMIPEKEVFLYALLEGLPIAGEQCPHMGRAARGPIKEMLMALEDATPGTRHSIVHAYDRLRPAIKELVGREAGPIDVCPRCGEPSVVGVCQACVLIDEVGAAFARAP
jgi:uncharacterized protein (TIGR00269 family)